jgi:hypothetical protein
MMARLIRDYSLSLTLAVFFIVSWLVQTVAGWFQFAAEQRNHGEPATAFGADGYFWDWAESTFENWQSEFLQLFTFVVLTAFLIHRKSAESKDSGEEMQAALHRIERSLEEIQNGRTDDRKKATKR